MAITHEGSAGSAFGFGNSYEANKPAGSGANAIFLAGIVTNGNATITALGWTEILSILFRFSTYELTLMRRVATGSEGSTFTFGLNGSFFGTVGISRFAGVDGTTPIDGTPATSPNVSPANPQVAPTMTTLTDGAMVVRFYAAEAPSSYTISGPTEFYDVPDATANTTLMSAGAIKTTAGSTGTQNATFGNIAEHGTVSLALKPVALEEPVITVPRNPYLYY